jgi:hypothetical protein
MKRALGTHPERGRMVVLRDMAADEERMAKLSASCFSKRSGASPNGSIIRLPFSSKDAE